MQKELTHNSRLERFRYPQGSLKAGSELTLMIEVRGEYTDVNLMLWSAGAKKDIPMSREGNEYTVRFSLPDEPCLVWYCFSLKEHDGKRIYYGGGSGEGDVFEDCPPGWQITVYDADFSTPRWFREGIMYQIFPDRFCRGAHSSKGLEYHRALGREPKVHDDWYEEPCYLPHEGKSFYIPDDFYLGDICGIESKLEYFKALGVSCIYLNPVFESASNHRYDTADYRRIDPILGDNAQFKAMCARFREHGIRVMLDGVFSHTGADSVYFNKYGRYPDKGAFASEDSPYRAWYDFNADGGYRAWWGFVELPEVNELDPVYTDFVMDGENSLIKFWAEHDINDWRLDVADELPDEFIRRLRARLKAIDGDAVLLGEVWEDASNKEAYGVRREYVLGHELDSVMNYPFRNAVLSFMLGRLDARGLNDALQIQRERYPKPFYYALMNLLSSHDIVRALTAFAGAPPRDALSREDQAAFTLTKTEAELGKARLIAATALQMSMPGVPSIYYGDEAGLTGMADPFNRKAYPWGREDVRLLDAFLAFSKARSGSIALKSGYCLMGAYGIDVFAVIRYTANGRDAFGNEAPDDAVICLINRANLPMFVRLRADMLNEGPDAGVEADINGVWVQVHGDRRVSCRSGVFEAVVPAQGALMFVRE